MRFCIGPDSEYWKWVAVLAENSARSSSPSTMHGINVPPSRISTKFGQYSSPNKPTSSTNLVRKVLGFSDSKEMERRGLNQVFGAVLTENLRMSPSRWAGQAEETELRSIKSLLDELQGLNNRDAELSSDLMRMLAPLARVERDG